MRVALDTNVLAYAEGINGAAKKQEALRLIQQLPANAAHLPVQTLGELFQLLVRKAKRSATQARAAILGWRDAFPVIETSETVMVAAVELAASHPLGIWDAVILASAAEGDCRLLLTEDLQEGFTWNGVTVTNPFAKLPHPLLRQLLS
ncbi:MAG TPA: PIN domain-containing protein [Candidatus Acidoferrum sp.]|nr:PIN domain-containing protein [Candidatus Acidoferrum sp.]